MKVLGWIGVTADFDTHIASHSPTRPVTPWKMNVTGLLIVICSALVCVHATASEHWFLPYEADEHTVVLYHLDGKGDIETSEGKASVDVEFSKGAAHGAGKFDGGAVLDGVRATLRCPKDERLHFRNDQEFTLEMWVRPGRTDAGLFSVGTRFYLKLYPPRKAATFGYRAASFPIRWASIAGVPVAPGRWMHIAVTHDRDRRVRLYCNGELVGETSHEDEGDFEKSGGAAFGSHDTWTAFLKGDIDEIRISDCVREFRPILAHRYYLQGEQVKLNVDTLPERVARVEVKIVDRGGKALLERTLSRDEIVQGLVKAEELSETESRLVMSFYDADGNVISEVSELVAFAGERESAAKEKLAAIKKLLPIAGQRRDTFSMFAEDINDLLRRRRFDLLDAKMRAAERVERAVTAGETRYRERLGKRIRSEELKADLRITMSWSALPEEAGKAFSWAKRLGANELVCTHRASSPEGVAEWKKNGYRTVGLRGIPIHYSDRVNEHPEERQYGYWTNDPVEADSRELSMAIQSPTWGGEKISTFYDIKKYWKVLDINSNQPVPSNKWEYDSDKGVVRLGDAIPGHKYRVYYMIETTGIGDPLFEPFAAASLEKLEEEVSPYEGKLDTYWFDDLAFAYPGPVPQKGWDWESYTLVARPESQVVFARDTGIAFDPVWLVMAPRTIEVTPRREYLRWMEWVQARVKKWMKRATDVVHRHNMRVWLYWGDCHVGIEPYKNSLEAGGVDQVDKPSGDAVTARALVDVPGNVFKRFRVDWLFAHTFADDKTGARLASKWNAAKRGLLMRPISGIYWMTFDRALAGGEGSIAEDGVQTIAEIDDEFRLIGTNLAGQSAFTHDLDLYVLNAWGKTYSWRPWNSPYLTPLTDLPIRVHFISFEEMEKRGVPKDADVILNYGLPNTAWSGGYFWGSRKVREAAQGFIENGGGFIGIQAPSYCEEPAPHWALAELFGLQAEGTAEYKPVPFDSSMLADTGREPGEEPESPGILMLKTSIGSNHWLSAACPAEIEEIRAPVAITVTAGDADVLYALKKEDGSMSPGVVARQNEKGRLVYLSGYSTHHSFYQVLRRAIFWAARREQDSDKLSVAGADNVFIYAYPESTLLALLNNNEGSTDAIVKCSPDVFGAGQEQGVVLLDVVTDEKLFEGKWSRLAGGVSIHLLPNLVRLLRVLTSGDKRAGQ